MDMVPPRGIDDDVVEIVIDDEGAVTAITSPATSADGRDAVAEALDHLETVAPSLAWHDQGADADEVARALLTAIVRGRS